MMRDNLCGYLLNLECRESGKKECPLGALSLRQAFVAALCAPKQVYLPKLWPQGKRQS